MWSWVQRKSNATIDFNWVAWITRGLINNFNLTKHGVLRLLSIPCYVFFYSEAFHDPWINGSSTRQLLKNGGQCKCIKMIWASIKAATILFGKVYYIVMQLLKYKPSKLVVIHPTKGTSSSTNKGKAKNTDDIDPRQQSTSEYMAPKSLVVNASLSFKKDGCFRVYRQLMSFNNCFIKN